MTRTVDINGVRCRPCDDVAMSLVSAIQGLDHTLQTHNSELARLCKAPPGHTDESAKRMTSSSSAPDELPSIHPEEKVVVYIRVVFLKVGEINTVKENFEATVFIWANWQEPALNGVSPADDVDWDVYWSPCLYIENTVGEPTESVWHTLSLDDLGHATVCEKRRVVGVFTEGMELKKFPFDSQDLTVTVTTDLSVDRVQLEEDRAESCTVNCQTFTGEQEWSLHSSVEVWKREVMSEFSNIGRRPTLSSSIKARRRPGFFIWNILIVMFFICSLSFATFAVSMEKPQNRLLQSYTLVLTTIAFKFVAHQSLPKISYRTYLDRYILISMGLLCTICAWHAIIGVTLYNLPVANNLNTTAAMGGPETVTSNHGTGTLGADLDKFVLITIVSIYLLFHIVFVLVIFLQAFLRDRRLSQKDVDYQK